MQLFNVLSVIKIPLAVKMLRDLSLPQANGKRLNGWSYTLRGLPREGHTLYGVLLHSSKLLKNKHSLLCPLYAMNAQHQSCLCSGKHFSQ